MASVQELKDALQTEQTRFVELAEKSLDAIDKINSQASFWISIVSIGIGVIALVGLAVIWAVMIKTARSVAEGKIKRFLATEDGIKFVRRAIQEEVKSQFQDKAFVYVKPLGEDESVDPFPSPPTDATNGEGK